MWPVSGWPIGWPVSAFHTRTVLSRLPETMRCPSGLNATLVTESACGRSAAGRSVGRCRRPTPARCCRALPEAMRVPSGLNATPHTACVWPVSGWPIGLAGVGVPQPHRVVETAGDDALPVGAERHTEHRVRCGRSAAGRRVGRCPRPTAAPCVSPLPETMRCPSGLNATLSTGSVWPVSGWPTGWPVSASHSRTVLSQLPETMRVPVGAERHADHRVRVAGQRRRRSGWPVSASHSRTVLSSTAGDDACARRG